MAQPGPYQSVKTEDGKLIFVKGSPGETSSDCAFRAKFIGEYRKKYGAEHMLSGLSKSQKALLSRRGMKY